MFPLDAQPQTPLTPQLLFAAHDQIKSMNNKKEWEKIETLARLHQRSMIIYLDVKCENPHFADQESSRSQQMMWFGEFVAHFSSEMYSTA